MKELQFLFWNINGYNIEKISHLKTLITLTNHNLVLLAETHESPMIQFQNWQELNFPKKKKGFKIIFRRDVKIKILENHSRWISFKLKTQNNNLRFLLIYAHG